MTYEHYWCISIAQIRRRAYFTNQRLAEVMNIQTAIFTLDPVRIIPEAVNSHILERRIFGKPFLRPKVCN